MGPQISVLCKTFKCEVKNDYFFVINMFFFYQNNGIQKKLKYCVTPLHKCIHTLIYIYIYDNIYLNTAVQIGRSL